MKIFITADDLKVAVKEYVLRRGLPDGVDLDVFVRGGRRGNSGTAEVTVVPKVGSEVPAPQIYENIFVPIEPIEDFEPVAEDHSDAAEEYFNSPITTAADLKNFDKADLKVVEPKVEEEPEEEEEQEEISVTPAPRAGSIGSMFGSPKPTEEIAAAPKKAANPFK